MIPLFYNEIKKINFIKNKNYTIEIIYDWDGLGTSINTLDLEQLKITFDINNMSYYKNLYQMQKIDSIIDSVNEKIDSVNEKIDSVNEKVFDINEEKIDADAQIAYNGAAYYSTLKYTKSNNSWGYYKFRINKNDKINLLANQVTYYLNGIYAFVQYDSNQFLSEISEVGDFAFIPIQNIINHTDQDTFEDSNFHQYDVNTIFDALDDGYLFVYCQKAVEINNITVKKLTFINKVYAIENNIINKLYISAAKELIPFDTFTKINIYATNKFIVHDINHAYGTVYIPVQAGNTYTIEINNLKLYVNTQSTFFYPGEIITAESDFNNLISLYTVPDKSEFDNDYFPILSYKCEFTAPTDGYLYQYLQIINNLSTNTRFYVSKKEFITDAINKNSTYNTTKINYTNPPLKLNIICSGSSITWGDGYLQASMVKYLDQIIKTEFSNSLMYNEMKYENGNIINNNLFYNGSAVMFSNINDSIEFDLYGNEIAICQVKRRSNDYGIISVYADDIKIGQFDNYNAPKHEVEIFSGSNIREVILKHPYTFNHQIYINGSNESINNIQINTQGYGASIQSGVDAFIYRHPINGGEDNAHALQLNSSLGTITSLRIEYDYGHLICYERSNLGQTTDNEFINESTYGAGTVSYDPDRPTSGISSGMEFRASNPDSFFIHKFTEYKNRHFKIVLEGGSANPYMMINFATNRYHNIMNAGIGGWDVKDLISSSNKLNKWTQFFKWFKPDFIFQESMTNDDWQFNTRRIKRDIGEITLEQLKVMPQLEIDSIIYNESTNKYRVYMCTGIISSITTTSLISIDIINTQTQVGDIVRIGNYYGDMHQIVCRKITEVNLSTGEIKWLEPIIVDNILNIDTIEDLIGKEINIRNLDTYTEYYETLINNIHSVSPNTNIIVVHNGLPNLYTRQLWGYDIIHKELAQYHNHVSCIDAQEDMYDTMFSTITGTKNEIITSTGASEYNLLFAGAYRSWQGFKVLVNGIDVYGKDCYIQGMMAYFIKDEYSGAQLNKTNCYDRSKCDWVNRGNMKLVFYKNIPSIGDTIEVQYADVIWSTDYCHPQSLGAYSYAQSYAKILKTNL